MLTLHLLDIYSLINRFQFNARLEVKQTVLCCAAIVMELFILGRNLGF